ncbi:MAG TPA: alpha-hydroxy-acid oxidizing protein [Actinophytocola sp.]|uniref:alpha-hydroxy-acid oxidizing protein n=1 Tax=Actinophytocola sp. TaxID=1872138 RepID=UPI002DDCE26E|nr:alpha-hydroxy-acid oxidizing protein [Actinophytocola sp.]HEV2780530.1 alpha-hydroxy-acid oxidizing protein [Actinophytocola sp.]
MTDLDTLLSVTDFEQRWMAKADRAIGQYVAGGAGTDRVVAANTAAFDDVWLQPRGLHDHPVNLDTTVTLFGQRQAFPVMLAPTSPQRLVHPDAELATARAAASRGVVSIVSTDSHYPYPDIVAAAPGRTWFQLFAYRSRRDVEATLEFAESCGAAAIVVTVDASFAARRLSTQRAGYRLPAGVDYGTLRALGILRGDPPSSGRHDKLPVTWDDLRWIRGRTELPLLVKGVLRPVDARRCVDLGADGTIVSNHGGRQLDGVVPTVFALEAVVDSVPAEHPVLLDGGVRCGISAAKAVALGARAVCIGRPYLWGLGLAGQHGVERVLDLLRDEFADAMLQLGISTVGELDRSFVAEPPRRYAAIR